MKYILIDTLNRIKNSMLKDHTYTKVKNSSLVIDLLTLLKNEAIILDFFVLNIKEIQVILSNKKFVLTNISTPKKQIYSSYKNINKSLPNFDNISNLLILNTSLGLKTYNDILKLKIGGEILFQITLIN